jgi:hypothetical protein
VLGGAVEHGVLATVTLAARALRDLECEDLATLERRPEPDQLDELRVVPGDLVHLVADAAGLVPGAPDLEAVRRLAGRELLNRPAALDTCELGGDAFAGELRALLVGEDQLDPEAAADPALDRQVDALLAQVAELCAPDRGRVHLQSITLRCAGSRRYQAQDNRRGRGSHAPSSHVSLP